MLQTDDPTAADRKLDHIQLAFESQVHGDSLDRRFDYEPMTTVHPLSGSWPSMDFLDKKMRIPLWVSSMTGGTAKAGRINRNLARACGEFGMGMGLGSCRQLLYGDEYLPDFDVRDDMGFDAPLFANLGVAQVERLFQEGESERIAALVSRLRADGLIIHINPLQEAMQPEGDRFLRPPLDVIRQALEIFDFPIIVKEVGQGFGPESMRALLRLPLAAIEFAAAGGTNFAKLELLRSTPEERDMFGRLAHVGHTAAEMLDMARAICADDSTDIRARHLIISGGIRDFLDGYYLVERSPLPAVYGQASGFLRHAQGEYADLQAFIGAQIKGLELARAFLRVRD